MAPYPIWVAVRVAVQCSPSPDKLVQEGACDERARGFQARRIDAESQGRRVPLALFVGFGILAAALGVATAAEQLPPLGVTLSATSVSGLSSGAYMAPVRSRSPTPRTSSGPAL